MHYFCTFSFTTVIFTFYIYTSISPQVLCNPLIANIFKKPDKTVEQRVVKEQESVPPVESDDESESEISPLQENLALEKVLDEHLDALPEDDASLAIADPEPVSEADPPIARKFWRDSAWSKQSSKIQVSKDMTKVKSYTFKFSQDILQQNFMGSKASKCTVQILCTDINMQQSTNCQNEFLEITDGLGGDLVMCGKMKFGKPRKASQEGTDLYVRYKGKNPSIRCTVKCDGSRAEVLTIKQDLLPKVDNTCTCGVGNPNAKKQGRIVGGKGASPHEFPWQVGVVYPGTRTPTCGAAIINNRYAICAGHCFSDPTTRPNEIELLAHAHLLDQTLQEGWSDVALGQEGSIRSPGYKLAKKTDSDENTLRLRVEEIVVHPLYDGENIDWDVSIIRFKDKIDFSKYPDIRPNCLETWTANTDYTGKNALVSGWGLAHEKAGGTTRLLQKLTMPMYDRTYCKSQNRVNITTRMICGGYVEGAKDACVGDSGGPISLVQNNKFLQIGVVSWGQGCARRKKLGVYGAIGEMRQWVQRMVQDDATWCKE